jgi:hypothetical protein
MKFQQKAASKQFISMNHKRDGIVDIKSGIGAVRKTTEIALSFFNFVLSHAPPRGFRCKKTSDNQRNRPESLDSKGNPICPLISPRENRPQDARADKLAKHPAQVHVGGEIGTEGEWAQAYAVVKV